jgi:hypothetical protein
MGSITLLISCWYYSVLVVSSFKLSPLIPLSNPQDKMKQKVSLFERERDFERGLRPLSLTLPSPARNIGRNS